MTGGEPCAVEGCEAGCQIHRLKEELETKNAEVVASAMLAGKGLHMLAGATSAVMTECGRVVPWSRTTTRGREVTCDACLVVLIALAGRL